MDSIVKWEYKILANLGESNFSEIKRNDGTSYTENKKTILEELGSQGWEVVTYHPNSGLILKRPCGEISITKHISQERNTVSYDGYER